MPRNIFQVTVNLPASFRNNINNNEVFNPYVFVRNRLYHFVFHRFSLLYARLLSDVHRKLIEFFILLASLFCFITLVYVHVVFVQTPMTCLDGYKDVWQRNGILRVEVLSGKSNENYTLQDSYWKEKTLRLQHFDGQSYYFYTEQAAKEEKAEPEKQVDVYRNASLKVDVLDDAVFDKVGYLESEGFEEEAEKGTEVEKGTEEESFQPILDEAILAAEPENAYIMEFSLEYGFLRLRPTKRRELNISVTFVVLDPEVNQCFGGSFNRFLLDTFLGYDNVLLASIKKMAEKKDQKGFVRNAVMDIEYIFINNWTNEKSYITAGFVMIIFTLTISTLLRHSHHQIFIVVGFWMNYVIATFGRPRMNMWPRNLIPSSGAPVLTVILALVGMEAVMSDFFHDRSIALYVIVIVWFADLYDAVCCQSALSKRHWFRFFYLYHFLFYAYNYKFGGVYWPLTLTTSWLFTLHSMVFFFHHYELPRFLHRAARMTAAHQAANNARPPGNPPNERPPENDDAPEPGPEQDNDEQDPPDNDGTPDQSTPETEDDEVGQDNEQSNSADQPGGTEGQPESSDEPSSEDDPGSENQPDCADQPESSDNLDCEDKSGSEDKPESSDHRDSEDQPGSEDHPDCEGHPDCEDQSGSEDQLDQSRFADRPESSEQYKSEEQPGIKDQPKSSDQYKSEEQPGSEDQLDQSSFADQPESSEQYKSEEQPGTEDQPKSSDQSSSEDECSSAGEYHSVDQLSGASQLTIDEADSSVQPSPICQSGQHTFENELGSANIILPIDLSRSGDKPKFTNKFESKDQGRFRDRLSSTGLSIFSCQNRDQLSSLNQPNLGCHDKCMDQLSSTNQPSFIHQSRCMDQPSFIEQSRCMDQFSFIEQSRCLDQPSSTDQPISESLVPNVIASNCVGVSLRGNRSMCTQCLQKHASFDDNFLQMSSDSLPKVAVPYLSKKVLSEVASHVDTGFASPELERFYNFAPKILDGKQGPASQDDVKVVSMPKKPSELCVAEKMLLNAAAVSFLKSPSLRSSQETTVPCLSTEQRFYVNAVEC